MKVRLHLGDREIEATRLGRVDPDHAPIINGRRRDAVWVRYDEGDRDHTGTTGIHLYSEIKPIE